MRKLLLFMTIVMIGFILVACGNNNNDSNSNAEEGNDNQSSTVDVDVAEALYKESCASCHGDDLEGDFGPALKTIGKDMSEDEIRQQIKDGAEDMPAEALKGADADEVAAWLATQK